MRMGLREANQHLSRAVKAVKAGREVILTECGRPVAVIEPLHAIGSADAAIGRPAGEGRLRLAPVPGPATRLETDPHERAAAVADTPRGPGCPLIRVR
jgi:prevent-host-death family protein